MADEPAKAPMYTAADLGLNDGDLAPADVSPQMLMIDRRYQRPLSGAKVLSMMELTEEQRQHPPALVGIRKSGAMYLCDRQHGAVAALLCGDPSIPALCFPSDGRKHEQAVYLALQQFEQDHGLGHLGKPDAPQSDSTKSNTHSIE